MAFDRAEGDASATTSMPYSTITVALAPTACFAVFVNASCTTGTRPDRPPTASPLPAGWAARTRSAVVLRTE
ncbi:hypothetical protein [Streptomyces mirabilis]|uniref:hypothetical protein n=1 Tax=Streptomyces mirabilis TaxID=68239 RepID=UPI00324317CB